MTAWDTDLGRWRLAWVEYLRTGRMPPPAPTHVPAGGFSFTFGDEPESSAPALSVVTRVDHATGTVTVGSESADDAFARELELAREVCRDEIDADAAVGVMPPAALVYAEPGGEA